MGSRVLGIVNSVLDFGWCAIMGAIATLNTEWAECMYQVFSCREWCSAVKGFLDNPCRYMACSYLPQVNKLLFSPPLDQNWYFRELHIHTAAILSIRKRSSLLWEWIFLAKIGNEKRAKILEVVGYVCVDQHLFILFIFVFKEKIKSREWSGW